MKYTLKEINLALKYAYKSNPESRFLKTMNRFFVSMRDVLDIKHDAGDSVEDVFHRYCDSLREEYGDRLYYDDVKSFVMVDMLTHGIDIEEVKDIYNTLRDNK